LVGLSGYKLKTGLDQYLHTAENGSHYTTSGLLPEAQALLDRLDAAQVVSAGQAYAAGASARQVAASVGVSKTGVLALLRELGLEPRAPRGLSEAQVDEAVELYTAGWLLREIGELYEVSRDCVRLALKQRGVRMRPGLGASEA
jgi:hypothetical protein